MKNKSVINYDTSPEILQWKEIAEDFLEDELQEIRKNYEAGQKKTLDYDETFYQAHNYKC